MSRPGLLVLGGSGQLGLAVRRHTAADGYAVVAPSSNELDLRDPVRLMALVEEVTPRFVFNCAAYTAVDRSETQQEAAFAINAAGAENVAAACAAVDARLIHVSTDYVFGGDSRRPYRESDEPVPINVYGASKLRGERLVVAAHAQSCVLRVSWLFAAASSSFVSKIVERARRGEPLRVVADQRGCPTSADGVADVMFRLIEAAQWDAGIYHYCGSPPTTWFEFAKEIVRQAAGIGLLPDEIGVTPIRTDELGAPARRPSNSVLDASKLCVRFGIKEDAWSDRLRAVLESIALVHR